MSQQFSLSATVWPQIWVRDTATDAGSPIKFDAHAAMLELDAKTFARAADEIIYSRGHDYDEVALKAGVIDKWLAGSEEATFYVDIDGDEYLDWLESLNLTEEEALSMDAAGMQALKERVVTLAPQEEEAGFSM